MPSDLIIDKAKPWWESNVHYINIFLFNIFCSHCCLRQFFYGFYETIFSREFPVTVFVFPDYVDFLKNNALLE